MRVGIGYDSHRFAANRPLILGGVNIPHPQGLAGHSDADAVCHALGDAMLGAAALGDIGRHFPDSSPEFRDANSVDLLVTIAERVREAGWQLHQADITIIAESPRMGPHIAAMQRTLAAALLTSPANMSIKAKTNEGMGFIGRGEGIAVLATATLALAGESNR